jgi:rubrerythrin
MIKSETKGEMTAERKITKEDLRRYRDNYLAEMDGIALYRALAAVEKEEKRAAVFEELARAEERHANRWAGLLKSAGEEAPVYHLSARVRLLGLLARFFGTERVLPIVSGLETKDENRYTGQP